MRLIGQTPEALRCDARGRPYFLWDVDMTEAELRERLADADLERRAYWMGKLMRQAKPEDVFLFLEPDAIARDWTALARFLGRTRPFWLWLLGKWGYALEG